MNANQTKVVNEAKKHLGKPYVYGGKGPASFDCSGLVQYVFKQALNMTVAAPTTSQEKLGKEVSLSALQPGDIVFYGNRGATYHDGIYIGNNQMIHAPKPGEVVTTVDFKYFAPQFARRVIAETSTPVIQDKYHKTGKFFKALKDCPSFIGDDFKVRSEWIFAKGAIFGISDIHVTPTGTTHARVGVNGGTIRVTLDKGWVSLVK